MALLSFQHVSKRFLDGRREVAVLEDVSFEIDPADYVGLWGKRRAGKSTVLRLASGIETPDEGSIIFDGKDLAKMDTEERVDQRRRGGIALAMLGLGAPANRPVVEYVYRPLLSCRMNPREAAAVARRVLKRVEAADIEDMWTSELQSSELVRVELARALVREPRLLLVDEPALLANPSEARALYALLRSLGQENELAVVIASRESNAFQGAPRVLTVGDGRVRTMDSEHKVLPFRRGGGGESSVAS